MNRKRINSNQSPEKKTSLLNVQILIVDDDSTSLAIVSSMLKTCSLQDHVGELSVVTVKNSIDALSTIRARNVAFDLVITDLHIPGMSGWELLEQIDEEFKIPVIIMSSNSKESDVLRSLESGAIFHMVKPVNQQDLNNVWQYAVASKNGKAVAPNQEMGTNIEEDTACSEPWVNGDGNHKRKYGKKRSRDNNEDEDSPSTNKRPKVVWTNCLHTRFLQAINHIGLEKAVPKKILEFMNVPGLNREHVASHLQKYRMFLKKVSERGFSSSQTLSERTLRSAFATGYSSFMSKNYHHELPPQQLRTFQPGYSSGPGSSSHGFSPYPTHEPPSTNSAPQFRYGQSSLLGTNFQIPTFNFSSFYQPNQARYGMLSNNTTNGFPAATTPPFAMYQQQNQTAGSSSNFHNNCNPPPCFQFNSSSSAGITNNNSLSPLNPNSKYAGIRLNNGELGTGQIRFNGNGLSSGFNSGYGSMNWINCNNNNLNNEPITGNGIFGFVPSQGGFSSSSSTSFGNLSAPGGSSSSSTGLVSYFAEGASFSSGFGNYTTQGGSSSSSSLFGSANQLSPPFTADNQESTSMLSPLAQQNTNASHENLVGANDFSFNIMNDDSAALGNVGNDLQDLGDGDFDLLFGSTNYSTAYQAQGEEGILNTGKAYQAELNSAVSVKELLNVEFSNSCTLADKAPWNEQSCGQGTEKMMNAYFGDNVSAGDGYFPSFEQPQFNRAQLMNSETNGMHQEWATTDENQGWGDDFLDSFWETTVTDG